MPILHATLARHTSLCTALQVFFVAERSSDLLLGLFASNVGVALCLTAFLAVAAAPVVVQLEDPRRRMAKILATIPTSSTRPSSQLRLPRRAPHAHPLCCPRAALEGLRDRAQAAIRELDDPSGEEGLADEQTPALDAESEDEEEAGDGEVDGVQAEPSGEMEPGDGESGLKAGAVCEEEKKGKEDGAVEERAGPAGSRIVSMPPHRNRGSLKHRGHPPEDPASPVSAPPLKVLGGPPTASSRARTRSSAAEGEAPLAHWAGTSPVVSASPTTRGARGPRGKRGTLAASGRASRPVHGLCRGKLGRIIATRFLIFLVSVCALGAVTFVTSWLSVQRAVFFSADVNNAGKRRYMSALSVVLVRELMRNDGQVYPDKQHLASVANASVDQLRFVHKSIGVRAARASQGGGATEGSGRGGAELTAFRFAWPPGRQPGPPPRRRRRPRPCARRPHVQVPLPAEGLQRARHAHVRARRVWWRARAPGDLPRRRGPPYCRIRRT